MPAPPRLSRERNPSLGVFDDGAVFDCFHEQARRDALNVLTFVVEFVVGVLMACIVTWLLALRMKEIKVCWKLHRQIRYYMGLTIIGTAVNLGLGISGTINVAIANPK